MTIKGKNAALILAGGKGSRMGLDLPKQFLPLAGKTVLEHTIERFENHPAIHSIVIVSHHDYLEKTEKIVSLGEHHKVRAVIAGGALRQDSSRLGIASLKQGEYKNVLIQDAARPFVSPDLINSILSALELHSAVNVGVPPSDTVIQIDENGFTEHVPDRAKIRLVQTPQAFQLELIREAHRLAQNSNFLSATDDCSLILKFNLAPVFVVAGSEKNIKITYPADLPLAEKILREWMEIESAIC